jgi:hypothetical protein
MFLGLGSTGRGQEHVKWLVEQTAAPQREEPVGDSARPHGISHQADARFSHWSWPERQLYEVQLTSSCDWAVSLVRRMRPCRENWRYRPKAGARRQGWRSLPQRMESSAIACRARERGGSRHPSGREIDIRSVAGPNAGVGFAPELFRRVAAAWGDKAPLDRSRLLLLALLNYALVGLIHRCPVQAFPGWRRPDISAPISSSSAESISLRAAG